MMKAPLRVIVLAVALLNCLSGWAATDTTIYIRELAQDPQPWAETPSGKEHLEPTYTAMPPDKADLVERSFSIISRRKDVAVPFTVERETASDITISTPVDAGTKHPRRVFVSDPKTDSGSNYVKSVNKNAWTQILYEGGYAGRKWELWWGDQPFER